MADTLTHRGPDDDGYYTSPQIGLGFRRLAIIDLNTGHQPIPNENGTVWAILNGEIYNYLELRADLVGRGHRFSTESDTEVIVHLYEELGVSCLDKLRGMFAIALWDTARRSLLLARDRIGIKPLYYAHSAHGVTFASELKAILVDSDVPKDVRPESIDRFLTINYLPGEETLFRAIHKLPPGHYLTAEDGAVAIQQYWDLEFSERSITERAAMEELDALLREVTALHLLSDVPVGVLLSGGVDSAAILSYAVERSNTQLKTFTLGFNDAAVEDERVLARTVAKQNGTDHYDITINATQFRDFLPSYVWHMEEPVCEPPGIALYYVTKLARQHVKVLLSGEGGDEGFAGYQTYRNFKWLHRLRSVLGRIASPTARTAAALGTALSMSRLTKYGTLLDLSLEEHYYSRSSDPTAFFNGSKTRLYTAPFASLMSAHDALAPIRDLHRRSSQYDLVNRMLFVDSKSWLPDDLLVKADKMTMANSVELRVPLLDHRLLEFAASLPASLKVHGWTTKYLLKKALTRRVPAEVLSKRKTGFLVPYNKWLRTDLKDWLSSLLLDKVATQRGYFSRPAVEGLLAENGTSGHYSKELFSLAVLELWHQRFVDQTA